MKPAAKSPLNFGKMKYTLNAMNNGTVQSQVTRDRIKRGLPKRLSPPC